MSRYCSLYCPIHCFPLLRLTYPFVFGSDMIRMHTDFHSDTIQDRLNIKLECGPKPNVMAALSNIGGAFCSTPQSLADAHY